MNGIKKIFRINSFIFKNSDITRCKKNISKNDWAIYAVMRLKTRLFNPYNTTPSY